METDKEISSADLALIKVILDHFSDMSNRHKKRFLYHLVHELFSDSKFKL